MLHFGAISTTALDQTKLWHIHLCGANKVLICFVLKINSHNLVNIHVVNIVGVAAVAMRIHFLVFKMLISCIFHFYL